MSRSAAATRPSEMTMSTSAKNRRAGDSSPRSLIMRKPRDSYASYTSPRGMNSTVGPPTAPSSRRGPLARTPRRTSGRSRRSPATSPAQYLARKHQALEILGSPPPHARPRVGGSVPRNQLARGRVCTRACLSCTRDGGAKSPAHASLIPELHR